MNLVRIGDKVLSRERIFRLIDRMLELRAGGMSQQDAAEQLGVDRTLISRLETVGELRKGQKIALAGFPVANADQLRQIAQAEALDFVFIMSEAERNDFARSQNGADLLNQVMTMIARARECDTVIFMGSDQRVQMVEALVGPRVIGIELGPSPINDDRWVDPEQVRMLIRSLKTE